MTATDRLALRWQFESFTNEFQTESWKQMVKEFAAAWKYKRNRAWIKRTLDRFQKCRTDLDIRWLAMMSMAGFSIPAKYWDKYAPPPKKDVYIGPETYMCM